jgi:2-oxoisovalerate dehydrogenase E1 component
MPKQIPVDPQATMVASHLDFPAIPVHAYQTPLARERATRGDRDLITMLRHMVLVREFETMLGSIKATGEYAGIEVKYRGPAHLSIGQEGAAVGGAWGLEPHDHIFGSHRSHGEFIAKALRAIHILPREDLSAAMSDRRHGSLHEATRKHLGGDGERDLAENFALFGLLAEIFMKSNGFNGGMGGSMHAFFTPFGIYPNNAIVGASAGVATGAALYRKLHDSTGITVSNVGDGATGCGLVWEAMNFAAMAQYKSLWDEQGYPPVLFMFNNNFYAMGGQTMGETMAWDRLSRIGAGIRADGLHAETVDGTNPLAVADAVARKRSLLIDGKGPAVLDIECYRSIGHSTTDANAYRSREELADWNNHDPIAKFSTALVAEGVATEADIEALKAECGERIARITAVAADPMAAPPVDINANPALIGGYVFSNQTTPPARSLTLDSVAGQCSRIRQLARRSRFGRSADGEDLSPMRKITVRDALFEAIATRMINDDSLIAYGEECREWGGAFGVYRGLSDFLPHQRLFNSPISEAAIVSTAVGYAIAGGRSLVELMYGDFIGRAGDEIFNQLAKWQAMSAGELALPVVLRCSLGSKYGAQHSQDWSALIAHIPGLKVIYPATPYDAKGLMASALAGNDPVVFFESQRLYDVGEIFHADGVPTEHYELDIGTPATRRGGSDITILTIGPSLYPALEAATTLVDSHGKTAEVIDARSLVPFNYQPLVASVEKTGRLLIVSEACERGSFAMTLAANIARFAGSALKTPARVLGTPNWIVPGAEMEESYFPDSARIMSAIGELLDLPGADTDTARREAMRRASVGL